MNQAEAAKIAAENVEPKLLHTIEEIYEMVKKSSNLGITNCDFNLPEKYLYLIKKELLDKGYKIFSECKTNYSRDEQIHYLEITWNQSAE